MLWNNWLPRQQTHLLNTFWIDKANNMHTTKFQLGNDKKLIVELWAFLRWPCLNRVIFYFFCTNAKIVHRQSNTYKMARGHLRLNVFLDENYRHIFIYIYIYVPGENVKLGQYCLHIISIDYCEFTLYCQRTSSSKLKCS